ncbi:MAG TPA: TatD family hydrolase [Chloroflexota bacterium]|jgi:TatD DNase family protein|nr:TatD family hydrolase [Chloroflexota bacterium]
MVGLVDSHAHLQSSAFDDDRAAALERARAAGVELIVLPATDAASCRAAIALARSGAPVAPAAGVHPNAVGALPADEWAELCQLAGEPEIVAVGETGLDYYRDRESAAAQRASFVRHLGLAAELGLPAIVHNRQADEDVLRAVADWGGVAVLHCFVGDLGFAERALGLGCYLGLGGPLTFKSSRALRETARQLPLDRILLETDSPFLAPAPHRGQRNEPAHVRLVAEKLAEARGLGLEEVARATSENARRVFRRVPAGSTRR